MTSLSTEEPTRAREASLPSAGSAPPEARSGDDAGGWVTPRPTRFSEFVRRTLTFPVRMGQHRDLIATSVRRELESRFTGTVLGWFWPLAQPLFLFFVYYFIFTQLLQFKLGFPLPKGQESALGIYMFCGILAWSGFAESLFRGAGSIVDNGNLIKKLSFPAEVLPLNVTLVGLVTISFGVAVFLLGATFTPIWTRPGWHVLWIPVVLCVQGLFTYGLTLLLSTLQVFLRDTVQVVGVLLTAWMFATPLFWVPEAILASEGASTLKSYLPLISANPMYHCVQAWRGALMGDLNIYADEALQVVTAKPVSVASVPEHLLLFLPWAIGVFVVGYGLFVYCQRRFADEV